jgi:hypothetical protein
MGVTVKDAQVKGEKAEYEPEKRAPDPQWYSGKFLQRRFLNLYLLV